MEPKFSPKATQKTKTRIQELLQNTEAIVRQSETELTSCKALLLEDIESLQKAKESIGFERFEKIFEKLGLPLRYHNEEEIDRSHIPQDEEHFEFVRPKEGRFGAFMGALSVMVIVAWGLLTAIATWLSLPVEAVVQNTEAFMRRFSAMASLEPHAWAGGALFVLIVTASGVGVYLLMRWVIDKRNLTFAQKQLQLAQNYVFEREACKQRTEAISEHVRNIIEIAQDYQALLDEKFGALERIYRFEKLKNPRLELHPDSQTIVDESVRLLQAIHTLLTTPLIDQGQLSAQTKSAFEKSKQTLTDALERLYPPIKEA